MVVISLLPLSAVRRFHISYLPLRSFFLFPLLLTHSINKVFFNHDSRGSPRIHCIEYRRSTNTVKMIDPTGWEVAFEVVKKTSSLLVPTPSPTPSVSPIPTVVPTRPHFERIGDAGTKTLWASISSTFPFASLTSFRLSSSSCFSHLLPSPPWHGRLQL